jgi:hypothetical protein
LPWETPRERLDKLRTKDRKSWKERKRKDWEGMGRGEERIGEERRAGQSRAEQGRDFSRCHQKFTLETQMILAWQKCSKSPLE